MPAGRPKTEASTYVRLYASLPPEMLADLQALAKEGERPINNELVRVVRAGLAAIKAEEAKPARHRIRQPLLESGGRP